MSEDDTPVRSKKQQNSSGFNDFCIKDIRLKDFGRREIEFAEQGNNILIISLDNNFNFCDPSNV